MGLPYFKSRNWPLGYRWRRPTRWHTIQEIRATYYYYYYYYYAVDDQWCTWGWLVVEAHRNWSELWGRIIERCIDVAHRTVKKEYFGTSAVSWGYNEQHTFMGDVTLILQPGDPLVTIILWCTLWVEFNSRWGEQCQWWSMIEDDRIEILIINLALWARFGSGVFPLHFRYGIRNSMMIREVWIHGAPWVIVLHDSPSGRWLVSLKADFLGLTYYLK